MQESAARLERGERSIEPSRWVDDLAAGRRTREEWAALARAV